MWVFAEFDTLSHEHRIRSPAIFIFINTGDDGSHMGTCHTYNSSHRLSPTGFNEPIRYFNGGYKFTCTLKCIDFLLEKDCLRQTFAR